MSGKAKVAPVENTSDAAVMARWAAVTDAKEALRRLVENETFLGYDPYYADLRGALLDMCERCSQDDPRDDCDNWRNEP